MTWAIAGVIAAGAVVDAILCASCASGDAAGRHSPDGRKDWGRAMSDEQDKATTALVKLLQLENDTSRAAIQGAIADLVQPIGDLRALNDSLCPVESDDFGDTTYRLLIHIYDSIIEIQEALRAALPKGLQ